MVDVAMEDRRRLLRMERILAGLLRYGALAASGSIAVGMAMRMLAGASSGVHAGLASRCMAIGIVLLIALPVLRVALTTAVFLYEGDYFFAAISSTVLGIIVLGFLLGTGVIHWQENGKNLRSMRFARGGRDVQAAKQSFLVPLGAAATPPDHRLRIHGSRVGEAQSGTGGLR
jgi:uncharacterized membrane protein